MIDDIKRLTDIGTALSAESHPARLMEMIVYGARMFTNAEGGSLYTRSDNYKYLKFEIVQNSFLDKKVNGLYGKTIWPEIKLVNDDGTENHSNVSAHVALTGDIINIDDVYKTKGFDFSGTKTFDDETAYRCKSMLVVPLKDHENEIIGVLQLINAQNPDNNSIIPFSSESQEVALSLASQAAVVMTKNKLIQELEELFNAFILTIAKAIDEKSPYTGGHIKRVANLTMVIAERINKINDGRFSNVSFTKEELNELRVAAWMHDIGKITIPEYVVDKATKLETIYDRINEIKTRFEVFKRDAEIKFLKKKIELIEANQLHKIEEFNKEYIHEMERIEDDLEVITHANIGSEFMSNDKIEKINDIAKDSWERCGKIVPRLTEDEVYNLTIKRGTLTDLEKNRIKEHVRLTEVMLNELPFPKKLKNVPRYASAHHEKLNGKGYHHGLTGNEISLQARIIAIADIFEALSASDRPYKKGKKVSEIMKIMDKLVKDNSIDKDVVEFFFKSDIFYDYIKKNYEPHQIDIPING